MDLQSLINVFTTTFNSDPNVRKAGELQIRQIAAQEGMVSALLQIIAADGVDIATRQACSVWLKNRVHKAYFDNAEGTSATPDDTTPVPQSDREAIKGSILPLLAASPTRAITVQLANVLRIVVQRAFPQRWPGLLDEVRRMLTSGDSRQIGAGCLAALECVRAFRYSQSPDPLSTIIEQLFPILVAIGNDIVAAPPSTVQDVPTMLHLIFKTYKTSLTSRLSAHQQAQESMVPWGRLCFTVVQLQVPLEVVPADEEEREKCEWWKAKKWAYGVLCRLFHRYGNPSQLPSLLKDKYLDFSQHFVNNYAPAIFKTFIQQMEAYMAQQVWLSKQVQYQLCTFLIECIKPASTWALLKPQFLTLVSSFVFPKLCFTQEMLELWQADPVEYLRLELDENDNFHTPVVVATSFLLSLTTNRTKSTFLPIMTFINDVLRSNAAPSQRYGALKMAVALGPLMTRHPQVKNSMESFVMQYIVPEMSSSDAYMKAIAIEMIGTVIKAGMQWSKENLHSVLKLVMLAVDNPELPVNVPAIIALTEIITHHDEVHEAVSPSVGKIIQDLLRLCDETELDALNYSMEAFVQSFHEELQPVAAQLTSRLCDSYGRILKEIAGSEEPADAEVVNVEVALDGDGGGDKAFTAMGLAKTIGTIISCVESSPEILAQISEVVIPPIIFTLENKIMDLIDTTYDLIDSITYKLRAIPTNMWPVLELTYKLFKSEAISWLDEMLPSLDNFVSFGTEVFKARPDYRQMLLDIYSTSMTSSSLGENDRVEGCKLAEAILLNLRGHVDEALQSIIYNGLGYLDKAETPAFRLTNLEVLINAVLYNPSAALHLMESHAAGAARVFFDKWFIAINGEDQLPRVHDKKLSIITLCTLLEMDPTAIPDSLKDGWHGIVAGALKIFKELPSAIEHRKALEDAFEDDDEQDEGDELLEGLNMDENDDDVWDQDSAYLEMLAREGERLRTKTAKLANGEDVTYIEEDSDSEIEEEIGYISPLDNVDPYISFKQALTTFQMKNAPSYQAATTMLDIEQQTFLMELMRIADENATSTPAS